MKKFLKRYCWLIVYGVFLIIDLSITTFFTNKAGIGRVEGTVSSGYWPFMMSTSTQGEGVPIFYIFMSPFILYITLAVYLVLYLVKKTKKLETKDIIEDFVCIVSLMLLGFVNFSALSVTPVTLGGFFFYKSAEETLVTYVLFAWLLILISRIALDVKRSSRLIHAKKSM